MSINTINSTLLQNDGASLCFPGTAVEFIQPWYTPIATTPSDTGIAIGGIGSSYTLTAAATTPVISFLPGLHVTGEETGDIRLQNWFASERSAETAPELTISNLPILTVANNFYPLYKADGSQWISDTSDIETIEKTIKEMVLCEDLFSTNSCALADYETEFSPKTQHLLNEKQGTPECNTAFLLDYFNGSLKIKNDWESSLTGDLEEKSINEISTYPRKAIQNKLLYPVAELSYQDDSHAVEIKKLHYSPIVRHDAKSCSLPANFCDIQLKNTSDETRILTLLWTQENISGFSVIKNRPGVQDAGFKLQKTARGQDNQLIDTQTSNGLFSGISLGTKEGVEFGDFKGKLTFGIFTEGDDSDISITRRATYYSEQSDDTVAEALRSGRLNNQFDCGVYSGREPLSAAIVVEVTLPPKTTKKLSYCQILDFPGIDLNDYQSSKKYTHFFEAENRTESLINHLATARKTLLSTIESDQKGLLDTIKDSSIYNENNSEESPLLTMALNTLSFNADATVWDKDDRFLVRECADYPFFNSLDVYFYGSFAMLWLLPEVDTSTMRYFKEAVMNQDDENRRFYVYVNTPTAKLPHPKYEGPRARKGAVIHDLGSPFDSKADAYNWHNVAEWKDLAPKYILMLLRNFHFTNDKALLEESWESVKTSIEYLKTMIPKEHHLPLTNGTDDTFDNLSSFGITLYCGSLWIAGLKAASKIAELLGKQEEAKEFQVFESDSLADFNAALWDETNQYFHFYSYPVVDKYIANKDSLIERLSKHIKISEDSTIRDINDFIYQDVDSSEFKTTETLEILDQNNISLTGTLFRERKLLRKAFILSIAGDSLLEIASEVLERESDDSFGDPLLADTYLQMMGLETVTTTTQRAGVLEKAYQTNFKANSPHVGYANLVAFDGAPKEAFQAQDVWIGVQYSNAASLLLAGENEKFHTIMQTLYENLYLKSKVPFAAPEGFNCSCTLSVEELKQVAREKAPDLHSALLEKGWLLSDFRVSSEFPDDLMKFRELAKQFLPEDRMADTHGLIQNTGLKYTAGRYFRPGMVFALPFLMKK